MNTIFRLSSAIRPGRAVAVSAILLIGLTTAATAIDTPQSTDLPDLAPIRAQIYSGEYEAAADALGELSQTVKHADVYNLLGFSLRNLARYDEAQDAYIQALTYDPAHRPALEYQGELYIAIGELGRARANASMLKVFCAEGCQELELLERKIAEAEAAEAEKGREGHK